MKNTAISKRFGVYSVIRKIVETLEEIKEIHNPNATSELFNSTNIETYGYCNRQCDHCFNASRFPKRDIGIMDEEIWIKIIDELSALKYIGRISPHFYGEPLLDKRIVQLIAYARKKCPQAFIRISTNGDMLTEALLIRLLENGMDKIVVTDHDGVRKEHLTNLSQKYPDYLNYRTFKDFTLKNRAGGIFCVEPSFKLRKYSMGHLRKEGIPETIVKRLKPLKNRKFTKECKLLAAVETHIGREQTARYQEEIMKYARIETIKTDSPCLRPSRQLVINWKGNVLLCCNDYYEEHIFGNVKNESIVKIWNSKKFKKYRGILSKEGGRQRFDLCKGCDT